MNKVFIKPEVSCRETGANQGLLTKERAGEPIWAGLGAAGGAVAGAVIGAVAGPIGAVLGLVACAFVGGLAGKGVAENNEPAVEEMSWQEDHSLGSPVKITAACRSGYRIIYDRYTQDRGKKYLEVHSGLAAQLREAQTFQSNLG